MKLALLAVSIVLALVFTGCISSKVKDFSDPDFIAHTTKKVLVIAGNEYFESAILDELKSLNVVYSTKSSVILPTRKYTTAQELEIFKSKGFDSILMVNLQDKDNHTSGYVTQSFSSGMSFTTAIVKQDLYTKAELYDIKSNRTIWVAKIYTKAEGAFYAKPSVQAEHIAEEVVSSLVKKGHFKNKKSK